MVLTVLSPDVVRLLFSRALKAVMGITTRSSDCAALVKYTDHLKDNIADADRLSEGVSTGKQIVGRGGTNQGHLGTVVLFLLREKTSLIDSSPFHVQIVGGDTLNPDSKLIVLYGYEVIPGDFRH